MRSTRRRSLTAATTLSAALAPAVAAQPAGPPHAGPARFLNVVTHTLRPGRDARFFGIERRIALAYARFEIPAYWISLRSITGAPTVLSLNVFDSFDEAERAVAAIGTIPTSHPSLARQQAELLTHTTDEHTVLTIRRDDIVTPKAVNLATMRWLRITKLTALPGKDAAVADALRTACAGSGHCIVYEADAGVSNPTFLLLAPLMSLMDVGNDMVARHASSPDVAKVACAGACIAAESQIYTVNPTVSHMPSAFMAGDPLFWTPQ